LLAEAVKISESANNIFSKDGAQYYQFYDKYQEYLDKLDNISILGNSELQTLFKDENLSKLLNALSNNKPEGLGGILSLDSFNKMINNQNFIKLLSDQNSLNLLTSDSLNLISNNSGLINTLMTDKKPFTDLQKLLGGPLIGPDGVDLSKKFRELLNNEDFFNILKEGGIQNFYNNEVLNIVIPDSIDKDFLLLGPVKDLLNKNKDLLKLLQNEELLNLMKNPEFLKLYDDPTIKNLFNNGDFQNLIAQKDFLNVIKDQDMLAMLKDENIQKFIQNQDFTKLLQEPGILEMLQDQKNVEVLSQILKDSQLEGFLKMHEAQKPNTGLIIGMGVLGIVSLDYNCISCCKTNDR